MTYPLDSVEERPHKLRRRFSTKFTSWKSKGVTLELVSTTDGVETWRGNVTH